LSRRGSCSVGVRVSKSWTISRYSGRN
jgi:hypothetical protein